MAKEIILDVHDLQPPEPMQQALDALDKLMPGEYLRMIHRMQPFPLFNILAENNFRYLVKPGAKGFDIFIWKISDKDSEHTINNLG
ncbi:MAG: DUF2249 domain-containing protein [Gammaproteobacteria bacterium]|nr:DUF2249 domain-containing protein [Gammaproteobacteria bacterium]